MSEEETGSSESALDPATQRRAVRERYGSIATGGAGASGTDDAGSARSSGCCGSGDEAADGAAVTDDSGSSSCCSPESGSVGGSADDEYAAKLGYSDDDVDAVAEGANLGLGCGNPTAIASLVPGETVLDLGSGAGFDCFLAANAVGESGQVIGVDMTPEMVEKARENAVRNDAGNVEFRLGEIEYLPVADGTVDVAISNCVINLSPDKPRVFREVFRVLRPGGRLSVSDVVLSAPVPDELRGDPTSVASCVAGAAPAEEVEAMLLQAGFVDVTVELEADSDAIVSEWDAERDLSEFVVSARITGRKPSEEAVAGE